MKAHGGSRGPRKRHVEQQTTHSAAASSAHSWHMGTMISSPAGTTTAVGMSNLPRIFGFVHHDFPVIEYQ